MKLIVPILLFLAFTWAIEHRENTPKSVILPPLHWVTDKSPVIPILPLLPPVIRLVPEKPVESVIPIQSRSGGFNGWRIVAKYEGGVVTIIRNDCEGGKGGPIHTSKANIQKFGSVHVSQPSGMSHRGKK